MNSEILFKNIFNRQLLQEDTAGFLEDLENKYPWFALPHFYKLKQTGIGDKAYNKQAALTAQFFPNIYILNQRLQQNNFTLLPEIAQVIPAHQEHEIDEPQPLIEPVTENIPITQQPETLMAEVREMEELQDEETADTEMENISAYTATEPVLETTASNSALEKAAADFKKEANTDHTAAGGPLFFEPLHATDYFASQGIKLSEEMQTADKLGKQMKSFTAWLKVMKKTPEQQQGLQQVADEAQIQNLANKSNAEAEVITESMAEIYLQQNKKEKARDIYKKLSLINPDKSAYFAAKIENLNKK